MPAWAGRIASSASRCAGRTATRKCGKTCRFEKSSGSLKGREMAASREKRQRSSALATSSPWQSTSVSASRQSRRSPHRRASRTRQRWHRSATLIQSGQIAQAQDRLREFDSAEPLVAYLRGLALYHADDHAKAIEPWPRSSRGCRRHTGAPRSRTGARPGALWGRAVPEAHPVSRGDTGVGARQHRAALFPRDSPTCRPERPTPRAARWR